MSFPMKPLDRSANRPIYLIVAKDATVKGKFQYYKTDNIVETNACIEFRGCVLSKAQADQVSTEPHAKITSADVEVNRKIPWHNVERIDNITYKMKIEAQGE